MTSINELFWDSIWSLVKKNFSIIFRRQFVESTGSTGRLAILPIRKNILITNSTAVVSVKLFYV